MNKSFHLVLALGFAIASTLALAAPEKRPLPPHHKRVSCQSCHGEAQPKIAKKIFCSQECHETPAEMAMLTREKFGIRNPHFSPHWLDTIPCEECHKQHKPPVNYCTEACHTFPEMVVK